MRLSTRLHRPLRLLAVAIPLGLLALLAYGVWASFFRTQPQPLGDSRGGSGVTVTADSAMVERFKYGSIGTEDRDGIPYWIWLVLPKIFPEYLPAPGGYGALGFTWEQGREMPIGFTKKTIGFERVGLNCALCHTATVRRPGEVTPRIYPGGPATKVDILGYQRFLFACASDPRFNASTILEAIAHVYDMPLSERLLYRFVLVPFTRTAIRKQKAQFAWTDTRPDWGRGRIDPFNPVKVRTLGVDPGKTIGNADMMAIWNQRPRVERQMALHWDGLQTDFTEVVNSSAIGDGATPRSLPVAELEALRDWLLDLPPPRFGDLFPIDGELAARGEPVFRQHCARCHAFDGELTGQVLKLEPAGWEAGLVASHGAPYTDPHRAAEWTPESAAAYNAYAAGEPWAFHHFRSTGGYVNVPLDGVWIRAPYLHNGSVPYLGELLEPPARRTPVFYRGHDVYDPERMGFVAEGPDAEREGFRFDTAEPGNSNQGHLWGVELPAEAKRALVEYLKTL